MSGRTRANHNLRLTREELELFKTAARLKGFDGWSSYLRHLGVTDARQTCVEHGFVQRAPDPNAPTLWEVSR